MERKIGEIFEYNGEWYQCVYNIHGNCDGCSFSSLNSFEYGSVCCESYLVGIHGKCGKVIFKKLEKVGEPFTISGTLYQHYKVFDIDNVCGDGFWCVHNYKAKTLTIEIKQNKEDMEEKKLNLKPFDIQKAKEGKPVCTRDGRKARIICFDVKAKKPIAALITNDDTEEAHFYYDNGRSDQYQEYRYDLMMLPKKKEGWVNVYYDKEGNIYTDENIFSSKEQAFTFCKNDKCKIATVKICWEE